MTNSVETVFVTRYALTQGIFEVSAEIHEDSQSKMVSYRAEGSRFTQYAHGTDWHKDYESALKKSELMRTKKIASLLKQISKLQSIDFKESK